jgi:hypothetical protein
MIPHQEETYSIFISYSHKDSDFALELYSKLSKHGFRKIFLDKIKVRPGDRFKEKILRALDGCTHFILVMTPDSMESIWVKREYRRALTRAYENGKRNIIPILLRDCQIPEKIKEEIQYVDFRSVDRREDAFNELLRGLTEQIRRLTVDLSLLKKAFCDHCYSGVCEELVWKIRDNKLMLSIDSKINEFYTRVLKGRKRFENWYKLIKDDGLICGVKIQDNFYNTHLAILQSLGCRRRSILRFIAVAHHSDRVLLSEEKIFMPNDSNGESSPSVVMNYAQTNLNLRIYDSNNAKNQLPAFSSS